MARYIDKDALVAEIKNLEDTYKKCPTRSSYEEGLKNGRLIGYKDALHKINTLETKEIDSESLDEKAIAKYLYKKKGYPITLNGNLPSYEETMKDANQYINYKKEQFIKKAAIWFNDYFASHDVYGVIAPFDTEEEMFEDFKNYMKGE